MRSAVAVGGTVLLLGLPLTAPARALGEDGPFELPLESGTVGVLPGAPTTIPLAALVEDEAQGDLDLSTARLSVPEGLPAREASLMEVRDGGTTLEVIGEGTWSLVGDAVVITPEEGVEAVTLPVALTVGSRFATTSEPAELTPETLELEEISERAPAREARRIPLGLDVPEGGQVRLTLDGLNAGSSLTADGSRLVVPEQGSWRLDADDSAVTYSPGGLPLGFQVSAPRFVVEDEEGAPVAAGRLILDVPIISDSYRSAPYGEDIVFTVGEHQQYVDLSTLALEVPAGVDGAVVSEDARRVEVPDQGTWTLDREAGTVRFDPVSADVTVAAPMGVTGADEDGHTADRGLMDPAYPVLADRVASARPGETVVIDLDSGLSQVVEESLRFAGAEEQGPPAVSEDGLTAEVPGEGVWELDLDTKQVTFTATDDFVGTTTPVRLQGEGLFAAQEVEAELEATVSPVVPTARDNEVSTGPQQAITVDVLANDTAGSGSQPLDTGTVRLRSLAATNLQDLDDGVGRRLVIPEQGTYTVGQAGAITFVPAEGFTGTTDPVDYLAWDDEGVPVSAELVVVVDESASSDPSGSEPGGINTLLSGILPAARDTSLVFGTIVLMMVVGGGVSLAIGVRMERERREDD